ncbi:hypothetical protein CYLTODRAFT_422578 [Cylindrobasidium torrendii FP15055 ss-10]|uniref:C2H2-type domain-containing protein n=1 Tax=Cylindrobasidium torrendii FP15055 ss-10 TaxID=1314674 RepID=A0A0D7BCX6_9AGAR|nr:hypothetical protein CYLTODRAFT_422578 [Cylindrobasidium torrendii FP15055 ss-10]
MDNSRNGATHNRATSTPTWSHTPTRQHRLPARPGGQLGTKYTGQPGDTYKSNEYGSPLNYTGYAPHLHSQISYMQASDPIHLAPQSSISARAVDGGHDSLSPGYSVFHPQHPQYSANNYYSAFSSPIHSTLLFGDSGSHTVSDAASASLIRQNTPYPQQPARAASMSMDKQFFCQHVECKAFHTGFTTKGARTRHIRDKHSGIPLRCRFCGKLFADSPSVGRHEKKCAPAPGV